MAEKSEKAMVREVTNNRESLVHIQLPPPEQTEQEKRSADVAAAAGRPRPVTLGPLISLVPGLNLVPKEQWDQAKKSPNAMLLLRTKIEPSPANEANPEKFGEFILVEGRELPAESPLKALRPSEAVERVASTLDAALLRAWLADEGRAEVRRSIEAQLDSIERPKDLQEGGKPPRARGKQE